MRRRRWVQGKGALAQVFHLEVYVRQPVLVLSILGLSLICGGPSHAQGQTRPSVSEDQLVEYYVQLAFGSEFDFLDVSSPGDLIVKRDQAIEVNIVPLPQPSVGLDETSPLVRQVAEQIAARSGGVRLKTLTMDEMAAILRQGDEAWKAILPDSVLVNIGNRNELQESLEKYGANPVIDQMYKGTFAPPLNAEFPLCLSWAAGRGRGSPFIGAAVVWVENGPALEECLYEEIMQSFGIANDLPDGTPSIFSDDRKYRVPTSMDWWLWRIHTDPRIEVGMNVDEVRVMARKILEEIGGFSDVE